MKKFLSAILCIMLICSMTVTVVAGDLKYYIEPKYDGGGYFSEGLAMVEKDGKWGMIDEKGKLVIPYKYDFIFGFFDGTCKVVNESKQGLIDKTGAEIIPIEYKIISRMGDGLFECETVDAKNKVYNTKGESTEYFYDYVGGLYEDMIVVERDGKKGYINSELKEVIPCIYRDAFDFGNGLAAVIKDSYRYIIDKTGKIIISNSPYEETGKYIMSSNGIGSFSEGLASVKEGFIDTEGNLVISFDYDSSTWKFNNGLVRVEKNDKYGFINSKGEVVVPLIYDYAASDFKEGLVIVAKGGKWYDREDSKYGFVNTKGEEVVPCIYDYAEDFHNGYARVSIGGEGVGSRYTGGKFGMVDKNGKEVVPCKYDYVGNSYKEGSFYFSFIDGMLPVSNGGSGSARRYTGGKWGYVNTDGKEVAPVIYDYAGSFCEGLGRVAKGDKWGFVDKNGDIAIPIKFDGVHQFMNGMAVFMRDNKMGFIDSNGKEVVAAKGKSQNINGMIIPKPFLRGYAPIAVGKKVGYLKNPITSYVEPVKSNVITGTYDEIQLVTLTCDTPDAIIYYRINDQILDSVTHLTEYSEPIPVTKSTVIYAYAIKKGMQRSPVATFDIEITPKAYKYTPVTTENPNE